MADDLVRRPGAWKSPRRPDLIIGGSKPPYEPGLDDEDVLPEMPVGFDVVPAGLPAEDLSGDLGWLRSTGITPLEFLAAVYRERSLPMIERLAAAKALLAHAHREQPRPPTLIGEDPAHKFAAAFDPSKLSDDELANLNLLLSKAATPESP